MVKFELVSDYTPSGDQPQAIKELITGIKEKKRFQTLLGATGTGKTFTMSNVIKEINMPTLVMAPNKLLAAQLYQEFKDFFPNNCVNYYISYFDYYQPEAYLPANGMYIEKDSSVNDEIMKYRLAAVHSLLTRSDVIIVASVSCIYGTGNPAEWAGKSIEISPGTEISRKQLMLKLIKIQYERNDIGFGRGNIRVRGDVVDVFPGYLDTFYRITFFGDEIESIFEHEPLTNAKIQEMPSLRIFPTREFVTLEDMIDTIVMQVNEELNERVALFKSQGKWAEAQRLEERVKYDMEMLAETGYCKGIENYSRFLDQRNAGDPPACLYDYFPNEFLLIMDESHIGIPQISGMVKGDQARKRNLVEYGFRLPSALDNRPLNFQEWEKKVCYVIATSATPGKYELEQSGNVWVDQVIRPTGLVDPEVEVRPVEHQIDDLLGEIRIEVNNGHRILVTTLTKRMAENISDYYGDLGIKIEYLHSDIDTVERMELIRKLRQGVFDVLVGINLLREGLDIPEVGMVAILDGDKSGFLRDTRSLIQTIGRASRNVNGRALIYADRETLAIKDAIRETNRRRVKQIAYNKEHGIVPTTISKRIQDSLSEEVDEEPRDKNSFRKILERTLSENTLEEDKMLDLERAMFEAAQDLEFETAAALRDLIAAIKSGKKSLNSLKIEKESKKVDKIKKEVSNIHEEHISDVQLLGTPKKSRKLAVKKKKRRN